MARRKREVFKTAVEITNEIENIDVQIEALTAQVKELKANKKKLIKDCAIAEAQEAEAAKAKQMEELASIIEKKGLTVEKLREMLEK